MKPIYKPKGKAGEYGEWAINIYTGCNHRCAYCYAPLVKRQDREQFHSVVEPRTNIVYETEKQLAADGFWNKGRLITLCFTCDPYPAEIDTMPTREIIRLIKASGNHVQILTKGGKRAERDFDLLDGNDWFGVTFSGADYHEPGAAPALERIETLAAAKELGIQTWVSCEPVIDPVPVHALIYLEDNIDLYKIGKLNYAPSNINWAEFGRECERLCKEHGRNYYIKEDLRKEMER